MYVSCIITRISLREIRKEFMLFMFLLLFIKFMTYLYDVNFEEVTE